MGFVDEVKGGVFGKYRWKEKEIDSIIVLNENEIEKLNGGKNSINKKLLGGGKYVFYVIMSCFFVMGFSG